MINDFDLDVRVGVAIKRLRQRAHMTQTELAHRVEASQGCISMIEKGHRNVGRLNLRLLMSIAQTLGQSRLSDLIRLAEDVPSAAAIIDEAEDYLCGKRGVSE